MFVYRLAAKLGIVDVDALQNALTDEQLMEWQAVAIIDGWFNGWSQTGEILAAIKEAANRQILTRVDPKNTEKAFKEMDWDSGAAIAAKLTDYSPKQSRKKRTVMNAEQAHKYMAARYG